jgi:drug/metabolite transporter (DMT)-like permease
MATVGLFKGDYRAERTKDVRARWPWLLLIGVILSLHFSTWFMSLFMTTVAASVVLVDSSPIFTAALSTVVLGERLGKTSWIGVLIAVVGAVILTWNDLMVQGIGALLGDILALSGAVFLALYFIGGRKYAVGLPNSVYTSIVYLAAATTTLVLCIISGIDVLVFEPTEVVIFIALAVFPTALGHSVNNYLLTLVPAYVVSSAVLGEPIGATLLAALILGEVPAPLSFVGFVIILFGIGLVLWDIALAERRKKLALDDSYGS